MGPPYSSRHLGHKEYLAVNLREVLNDLQKLIHFFFFLMEP